jgi:predicted GNAT family N-acyltransferase
MPTKTRVFHATEADLPAVRALLHATFVREKPAAEIPFYTRYEVCDPDYRPGQYLFRRLGRQVVSALKVFVRRLHHPAGPVLVTIIGGVCTREDLRGRGLVRPVIEESLRYSRRLGARAELIVTPRRGYYLRHGFRYFDTVVHEGLVPSIRLGDAGVGMIMADDAAWMTEAYNRQPQAYGPIVRSEAYVREWVLGMRLTRLEKVRLKLLRNGRPTAYLIGEVGKGLDSAQGEPGARVIEAVTESGDGEDAARLLAFLARFGIRRFVAGLPDSHPLIASLRRHRVPLRRSAEQRFMYYPLDPAFPIPDEEFYYSSLDLV